MHVDPVLLWIQLSTRQLSRHAAALLAGRHPCRLPSPPRCAQRPPRGRAPAPGPAPGGLYADTRPPGARLVPERLGRNRGLDSATREHYGRRLRGVQGCRLRSGRDRCGGVGVCRARLVEAPTGLGGIGRAFGGDIAVIGGGTAAGPIPGPIALISCLYVCKPEGELGARR